jgi:hypothetical protein
MKKKIVILVAAIMLLSTAGLSAFGLGLQGDWNAGTNGTGVSLTFKTDSIPLVFAANWNIGEKMQTVGLTGDYWLFNKPITKFADGSLNWFVGVGFFARATFFDSKADFGAGVRIPVGLNAFIAENVIEPYIQFAPSFGVNFVPSLGAGTPFWPLSAGIRIWFK